jgi:hypothetical protein
MNDLLRAVVPTIAAALGGPLAGIAAGVITEKLGIPKDTVENVTALIKGMSPDKIAELKIAELELKLKLETLGYESIQKIEELNTRSIEAVNATMRAEAASEHWPTYSWRPFIGFMFGFYIGSMFILPLFGKTPVTLSADLVLAIGAILGVASWYRGKMQADPNISTVNKG